MTHSDLVTASEHLERASELADESRTERLRDQAATMQRLAEADRGADHGRLARHEHKLRSLADGADENVVEEVETALSAIRSFRETVEGV